MKVALSTIGKFHTFDLARELHARGALAGVATGYPRFKLAGEGIPAELIRSFPLVHGAYMAFPWKDRAPVWLMRAWERLDAVTFAAFAARALPPCDVFVGLSGSALKAGRRAQSGGARYICDRGSSHIRAQDRLLREEESLWGLSEGAGVDPRVIDAEEAEYAAADAITIPSKFAQRTFLENGAPAEKLRLLPYGVDLARFEPAAAPAEGRFDVLFVGAMSLRKGVQYLTQAFARVDHPAKCLAFVGSPDQPLIDLLRRRGLWPEEAKLVGHMPQARLKEVMSRSHVMVLPSVEDGFGVVLAQAMACGCPVIGTHNTGAPDLVADGEEGFLVAPRDVDALADRLQRLADRPQQRDAMGAKALERVQSLGGWRDYGDQAMMIYADLAAG